MKQSDFKPCVGCGKGVFHDRNFVFYRLRVAYLVADVSAIQRQHGMELMMGAAAPLAQIMGPNEDLAATVDEGDVLVCLECATRKCLAELWEKANTEDPTP